MNIMGKYNTFSLADEEEYIEEEEIIERDVYVDGEEEPYYEEDVEEEYNEEHEEYHEDEYEDDGEYYEEGYEEGYDDHYPEEYPAEEEYFEDERLNQVLDELAELKRSMGASSAPATVQPSATAQPGSSSFAFSQNPAVHSNNDEVIYNELSRLRSELGKAQMTQEMHTELARIKEQMERDSRQNETGLKLEIRRLQDKIDDMGNAHVVRNDFSNKHANITPSRTVGSVGGTCNAEEVMREEFYKLLEINESILQAVSDSGQRQQQYIADIRKRVEKLPDFDALRQDIMDLKHNMDSVNATDPDRICSDIADLKESASQQDAQIMRELQALKNNGLSVSTGSAPAAIDLSALEDKLSSINQNAAILDTSELLRQLFEIKMLVGSQNTSIEKRNKAVLDLLNELNKVKCDLDSKTLPLYEKLRTVDDFNKKLIASGEPEAFDINQSLCTASNRLLAQKLDKKNIAALKEFAQTSESVTFNPSKREVVADYIEISDYVKSVNVIDAVGSLRDLVDAVDIIQEHAHAAKNAETYNEILDLADEIASQEGSSVLEHEASQKINQLCSVTAGEFLSYAPKALPRTYRQPLTIEGGALIDKLGELKNVVAGASFESNAENSEASNASMAIVLSEIDTCKKELSNLFMQDDVLQAVMMLQQTSLDILDRVDALATQAQEEVQDVSQAETAAVVSDIAEDIVFIKEKLAIQDDVVAQLAALRSDIAAIDLKSNDFIAEDSTNKPTTQEVVRKSEAVAVVENASPNLVEQFNLLYEDLASSIATSATPIQEQLTALSDSIATLDSSIQILQDLSLAADTKTTSVEELTRTIVDDVAELKAYVMSDKGSVAQIAQDDSRNDMLQGEINLLREMQEDKDNLTREQSEAIQDQIATLLDEMAELKSDLNTQDIPSPEETIQEESVNLSLSEITDKLDTLLYGTGGEDIDNIQLLIADISEIKEKLYAVDETVAETLAKINENLGEIAVAHISNTAEREAVAMVTNQPGEEVLLILEDISDIKNKIREMSENATQDTAEVKDCVSSSRIREATELANELEGIFSELKQLKLDISQLGEIRSQIHEYREDVKTAELQSPTIEDVSQILDELAVLREEIKTTGTAPTSEEITMLVGEVVALRDEMQVYRDELANSTHKNEIVESTAQSTLTDQNFNTLIDELGVLRGEVHACSELAVAQNSDIEEIRGGIEELKEAVTRRNTVVVDEISKSNEMASADEMATVLDEVIDLKTTMDTMSGEFDAIKNERNAHLEEEMASIKDLLVQILAEKEQSQTANIDENCYVDPLEESEVKEDVAATQQANEFNELREQLVLLAEQNAQIAAQNTYFVEYVQQMQEEKRLAEEAAAQAALEEEERRVLEEELRAEYGQEDAHISTTTQDGMYAKTSPVAQDSSAEFAVIMMDEFASIKEQIAVLSGAMAVFTEDSSKSQVQTEAVFAEDGTVLSGASTAEGVVATNETESTHAYAVILDELAQLREDIATMAQSRITQTSDYPKTSPRNFMRTGELIVGEPVFDAQGEQLEVYPSSETQIFNADAELIERTSYAEDTLTDAFNPQMQIATEHTSTASDSVMQIVLDELSAIREELATRDARPVMEVTEADSTSSDALIVVLDEINVLKEQLSNMMAQSSDIDENANIATNQDSFAILFDEINTLKEQITNWSMAENPAVSESMSNENAVAQNALLNEIMALRQEVIQLKASEPETVLTQINEVNDKVSDLESVLRIFSDEPDRSIISEILALRDEFQAFKDELEDARVKKLQETSIYQPTNEEIITEISTLSKQVEILKEELQHARDNKVENEDETIAPSQLLLEVQSLRDEVSGIAKGEANSEIFAELQSLREQLFAISMAHVTSGAGDSEYESYNNIILDELSALKEELEHVKSAPALESVSGEIAAIRETVTHNVSQMRESVATHVLQIKETVQDNAATSEQVESMQRQIASLVDILESINADAKQIEALRLDVNANLEANEALVNFMSGVVDMVEKQNLTLASMSGMSAEKLEILKSEIAASVSQSARNEQVSADIAVREIAKLKEEIVREGFAKQDNAKVLEEIRRVKEEIGVMIADRNTHAEPQEDLSQSLSDLKAELSNIADFVTESDDVSAPKATAKKTTAKKAAPKNSAAKKPATKKSTATKSSSTKKVADAKPKSSAAKKPATAKPKEVVAPSQQDDDFVEEVAIIRPEIITPQNLREPSTAPAIRRIESIFTETKSSSSSSYESHQFAEFRLEESEDLLSKIDRDSIDIAKKMQQEENIQFKTVDELIVASRLAKQVANKLVMEQLVHQLGDGGVSQSKVEEIVREILPQEFKTIQTDEDNDRVRRLANSLVLDRLRAKLTGDKE